jgi:uncharacterized protein YjiS (DUF1127 family)
MASLNNRASVKRSMRAPRGLSPLQRAYLMGLRRARIQARYDVTAFAGQFEAANDQVHAELRGVRREMARLRAIDHALEAERGDTLPLSESAQGSRSVALSAKVKSAPLLIASSTLSPVSRLMGKLRAWRQRERERAELGRMSQAELHDIGVSSSEHWAEISKPFWRK